MPRISISWVVNVDQIKLDFTCILFSIINIDQVLYMSPYVLAIYEQCTFVFLLIDFPLCMPISSFNRFFWKYICTVRIYVCMYIFDCVFTIFLFGYKVWFWQGSTHAGLYYSKLLHYFIFVLLHSLSLRYF